MKTPDKAIELVRELYEAFKQEIESDDEINGGDAVNTIVDWWHRARELIDAIDQEEDEKASMQHEIRMTDDPHYRDHHRRQLAKAAIDEHGIDED